MRALNAGGVDEKSRFSTNRDRSMTAAVRTTTATVHRAVYRTDRHESANLVYHNQHRRSRRREENRAEFS